MTMKRINVVGTSATGKSTFSRALAEKLRLHYIELDNLFWLDDWQECPDEIFFARIEAEIAKAKNGYVIAQDEDTCVVYGMPRAVIDANMADIVLPLDKITEEIMKIL